MIMCMFKHMMAVTCRSLCRIPFLEQLEWLAKKQPSAILLREKDLKEEEYAQLARAVLAICKEHQVPYIIHTWTEVARQLKCENIHLLFHQLLNEPNVLHEFKQVGVSIHSVEEAMKAECLGVSYAIAGHIFPTACKKGVPPRGLLFLRDVCQAVQIPVYGIGGITEKNASLVLEQGAKGYCVMSGAMKMSGEQDL